MTDPDEPLATVIRSPTRAFSTEKPSGSSRSLLGAHRPEVMAVAARVRTVRYLAPPADSWTDGSTADAQTLARRYQSTKIQMTRPRTYESAHSPVPMAPVGYLTCDSAEHALCSKPELSVNRNEVQRSPQITADARAGCGGSLLPAVEGDELSHRRDVAGSDSGADSPEIGDPAAELARYWGGRSRPRSRP